MLRPFVKGLAFTAAGLCAAALLIAPSAVGAAPAPGSVAPAGGAVTPISPLNGIGYTPVTPARLLDTRPTGVTVDGLDQGGGTLGPATSRTIDVAGRGGVPDTGVEAVVLHITAVGQTVRTFVTVWPAGLAQPTTSNLNPIPGGAASNLVIVGLGAAGDVTLFNNAGSLHLIVDVVGWFPTGPVFDGLGPDRALDTRLFSDPIGPGETIELQLAGFADVPASGASAVALNVTAVGATSNTFITVHPAGSGRPPTSNLNAQPGLVAANHVVAELSTDGWISIYNNSGNVHVVVDVMGWFADGLGYTPVFPTRVLNTRTGTPLAAHSTTTIHLAGTAGLPPAGVGAVVFNLTAVNQTAATFLTVYPDGAARPNTSDLNPRPGVVAPNLVVAKVGPSGSVQLYNENGTVDVLVDVVGWMPSNVVVNPDSATLTEDDPATAIPVLANDTDFDGGPLAIASVTVPANGTVVVAPGGSGLTYEPGANYCNTQLGGVPDTFDYTLYGGLSETVVVTVTCVDDLPVANDDEGTVAEDSAAAPVAVLADDTDVDDGPFAIESVTQPANGTVVITGGGTGLTYAPNADYCNTPPGSALDTFAYTVSGGATATVTMTVNCVDDAPLAVVDSATVTEDDAAAAIAVLANDTDVDAGPLSIASVTQPANGTVVITGGGTGLTYEPDSNYCNTPGGPDDTFGYTLSPGGSSASVTVAVTCVEDAPVAVADSATVGEDSGVNALSVLANDTDVDAGLIDIVSVTQPGDGTVVITGGGTGVSYEPNENVCNTPPGSSLDTFTYTLNGGSSATVTVTITCVDDTPAAVADSTTVGEDSGAGAIDVVANDTDFDGGPLSITSVTQPADGTVVITGGGTGLTYAPDANYCNNPPGTTPDTFTYTLAPGGSTATVSVTVNCVDDAPAAVDDLAGAGEDAGIVAVDVLANDTDVDGGPKTVTAASTPLHGSVNFSATSIDYFTAENYCGADSFTYTLNGGSTATVDVTIACVDDSPVAVADSLTVTEDDAATAADVLANDPDVDAGPISISSATQPANGTVVITGGGTGLTYAPGADYCNDPPGTTPDTFTYTLAPGGSVATVSVTVDCVDDAAVANDDLATVTQDDPATAIDVLSNDVDVDGDPFLITAVDQPENGIAAITGGGTGLDYTPDTDFCTTGSGLSEDFQYTITGGDQAIVHVTVTCLDDPPVAEGDSATVDEDAAATAIDVLFNDQDTDGGPISVASVTQPANGTVLITGGGTGLTYQPHANYCNAPPSTTPDSFEYTLAPGSSTAAVTVYVTCIDDAPVAVSNSAAVNEDSSDQSLNVLNNDTDIDGGPRSIASVTQPANGTVAITGGGTGVSYTPDSDYCNNPPGSPLDTFSYTLSPGGSTADVAVTVECFDDAPQPVGDAATVIEDSSAGAVDVLANDIDIDGGPIAIESVSQPANGTVVITGGGTGLTYAPNSNYCNNPPGSTLDAFTYTVTPGSVAVLVNMTVTCVDDLPTAINDSLSIGEDGQAPALVLGNDTDIDGGPLSITSVTQPANGTVAITGLGTGLTYEGDPNYCNFVLSPVGPADTFTYTLNGGSTATVDMTVTCHNDSPVSLSYSRAFGSLPNMRFTQPAAGGLLSGFSDPDGATTLTVSNVSATSPAGGVVAVNPDGSFTFDPPPGASGAVTFSYEVCDNGIPLPSACSPTTLVTLNLTGEVIWFVDDSAAVTGDGTLNKPFQTLAEATAATDVNESVFLFSGSYTGGQTMDSGGWLIGQPTTGSDFDTFFGLGAVPSGVQTRPTLGTGSVAVSGQVTLATNAKVRGLALSNTTATVLAGTSATLVDVDQTTISSTNAIALDLNTVTGTVVIDTLTQTGGTHGVRVQNSSAAINIKAGSITNSTTAAVSYANGAATNSPTFTYAGTVSVAAGRAVEITGGTGTPTLNFTGNITTTGGTGVSMSGTAAGSKALFTGVLTLSTGVNDAFTATSGTVEATNTANTLATTTGRALNISNATISPGGLEFRSISAGIGASGPTNGIVLNNTGITAGLTVSGTGSAGSGGTIQRTTGAGILLSNTRDVSFDRMVIDNTGGSGISGTGVTNFTFANGTVSNSGDSALEANIAFNNGTGLGNNIAGTLTITGSTLTNGFSAGIDVQSDNGTVSNATITDNTVTGPGAGTAGISLVGTGNGSTAFNLTKATIDGNNVTSAGSAGIQVSIGNSSVGGPGASAGVLNDATNIIAITNNGVTLDATGTNSIIVANSGGNSGSRTQTNFLVECNGKSTGGCTAPGPLNGSAAGGTVVLVGNNGFADMSGTVNNNLIDANHTPLSAGGNGIGGGNGVAGAGNAWTPSLTLTVSNNVITDTDGNGILLVGRGTSGVARFKVQNNVVAAPINVGGSARYGIRIDAGNAASADDAVCLNISGNTSAGSNTAVGIGLRKQGTVATTNDFSINGMAATSSPGIETYVNSLNPVGGSTELISAASGFTNCSLP